MATARPFTYNPSLVPIEGTIQVGDLAVGFPTSGFTDSPQFWNGPDEELGYVIAQSVPSNTQPTPVTNNRLYLSPIYKAVDISLSNNNQTATQVFSYQQSVLGEKKFEAPDKFMFSVQFNSTNPSVGIGGRFVGMGGTDMNYQGPFDGYPGNDVFSTGFSDDGKLYYNGGVIDPGMPTWTSGDIIDVAVNLKISSSLWWIRVNGGPWNNYVQGDPSTDNVGVPMEIGNSYPTLCPYIYGSMTIQNYPTFDVPSGYRFLGNTLASVSFFRSPLLTENSFVEYTNSLFNQSFTGASEASVWLTTNGYWNSYSCLGIATNSGGGLNGWNPTAFDIAFNPAVGTTYPVGSQITFQNGEVRTMVQVDDYGYYMDVFYDSPISSSILFPITICS